jgi:hypothetical protein
MKSGRKDLSNISPPGRAPDEGPDGFIGKRFRKDPHLLTRKTSKALS